LKKISDFINTELLWKELPTKAVELVTWALGINIVFGILFATLHIEYSQSVAHIEITDYKCWFLVIISGPAAEEAIFRLPLALVLNHTKNIKVLFGSAIILSCWFGISHGNIANLATQGLSGLLFSLLFLKAGITGNIAKAFCASYFAHSLFNTYIMSLLMLNFLVEKIH
jgi:hypothetical protein